MQLRQLHVIVGLTTLALFVLSGQYLHWVVGPLAQMSDAPRLLFRTSHLYLMFAGACNLALGLYLTLRDARRSRALQLFGSVLLLLAPLLILVSFLVESADPQEGLRRPLAALGAFATFGGVLLHALATWQPRTSASRAD